MMMRKTGTALMLLVALSTSHGAHAQPAHDTGRKTAAPGSLAFQNDVAVIENTRRGLENIIAYMKGRPDLFPPSDRVSIRVMSSAERQEVRQLWASFLDHLLILDSVSQKHASYATIKDKSASRTSFRVGLAAYLSRYRHALEFISLTDNDPALRIVLDEPVSEIGLPPRTYASFKLRHLNAFIATEFAALSSTYRWYGEDSTLSLTEAMRRDAEHIWKSGPGSGLKHTLSNAAQVVQGAGFKVFFPVQKGVSEWMGDTRVLYGKTFLVKEAQISQMAPLLRPGDVLLERREWFLSNIGLPGYWPHAALYVGTPQERAAWFDDPEVKAWLLGQGVTDGSIDTLLRSRFPTAYELSLAKDDHGDAPQVLEAMSEGVVFTSLSHSAGADSVAVLRPRLSRLDLAQALVTAFKYQGRPYDFDFDFRTDVALVCTELIYKAFGTEPGKTGLRFPLRTVAGRPVTTANDIARQFDETFGQAEQQFDLVVFMDGQQRKGQATEADLASFRTSWRRPKWHILMQNTPQAAAPPQPDN
jgi:hypothetical protein